MHRVVPLVAAAIAAPVPALAFTDHLFVVTSNGTTAGSSAAVQLQSPWTVTPGVEPVGASPRVRHFAGLHYIVSGTPADDLRVLDPTSFEPVRIIPFAAGSNPQDVLAVDATVFVSFYDSASLQRFDVASGALIASIDLTPFADSDGLPEAGCMIRDGNHLFVELQCLDRSPHPEAQVAGQLAVVDIGTNQLVDADPMVPGTQGIVLTGVLPRLPMQIEARTLYVSVPGFFHDQSGGIEAVDLDELSSLGFAFVEKQIGAGQMSAFLFVSPERGYYVHHTDLLQSSHLVSFSRTTGSFLREHFVSFGLVERLAYDSTTGLIYFPDNDPTTHGIRVFDAATGAQLTTTPVVVGLPPADLALARGTPTDALPGSRLRIWAAPNPTHGPVTLFWESPAAQTFRWTLVDARGRLVRSWSSSERFWDGMDASGSPVATGVDDLHATGDARASASTTIHVVR